MYFNVDEEDDLDEYVVDDDDDSDDDDDDDDGDDDGDDDDEDDDGERKMMRSRKMMKLRRMMLRRKTDPKTVKHTLCESAQSNAHGHVRRGILCRKLHGKCRTLPIPPRLNTGPYHFR